ncbi:amino acid permease [Pseudidiomarina sediminum]|uniref:Amino acid permease n=1 Tax=Pseudidiomarina sediminum TaxID=431675 RepID=A0A432Z2N5_9GAMM|nr:APC family permease [Pseudidiomarina sediminum]RUO72135.1 amino acid permease [Pseudidiomarina sediminum]
MTTQLVRSTGMVGAIMLGLGSILGTGVFVSLGFGYALAGDALLYAIAVAAFVALCNGLSSAQLAAAHPVSGGTYEYAYQYLNRHWAFVAGWVFICAKSASAAAALLASAYLLLASFMSGEIPAAAVIAVALLLLGALTVLVLCGVQRSNQVNGVLVTLTLLSLGVFVASLASTPVAESVANKAHTVSVSTVLSAVALLFVAYTGYGRVATLGEEVKQPRRTIPRAIVATLVVVMALYLLVGSVLVRHAPEFELTNFNLSQLLASGWQQEVVRLGAALAMIGVALNLLLGVSRVVLAMARRGDLPRAWARLNQARSAAPYATLVTALIIAVVAMFGSVIGAWSLSALTVLMYYGITNLAALKVPPSQRFIAKPWSIVGLFSCFALIFVVPVQFLWLGMGSLVFAWALRLRYQFLRQG